ncbi:MAG: HD-like signal output (HDOD) protein [Gammaproteobacteria bacterium]
MSAIKPHTESNETLSREEALRRIRKLIPLRHFSDPEFETITDATQLQFCKANSTLFRSGEHDDKLFYLLIGEVSISDADNESFCISGGSIEACHPLTAHPKVRCLATAISNVQFVSLPANLVGLQRNELEAVTVDEITEENADLEQQILFDIYHTLMSGDLVLPSLPDVAIQIRRAADDENVAVEDIARIIQGDPGTAAYCIKVANSAALSGTAPVASVLQAVVRIGIGPIRDLVIAHTIRSLFTGKERVAKEFLRLAWQHSCRIAALSYVLARDVAKLSPERGLLAGLLHDIGISVVVSAACQNKGVLAEPTILHKLCVELSGQVGAMVLRAWHFPDVFVDATLESESYCKPVSDRLQFVDVVMLAHLHDPQPPPWSLEHHELSLLPVHRKLRDHEFNVGSGLAVIDDAQVELAELTAVLSN